MIGAMQSLIRKILIVVVAAGIALLTLGVILILSPLIILLIIIGYFRHDPFEKDYQSFLIQNEGVKFFCYNNRKTSQRLVEEKIVPNLPDNFKIIFLEGKRPRSTFEEHMVSRLLYSIKGGKGLPSLLRIVNGKVEHLSLHKDLYNRISEKKDLYDLIERIRSF